MHEICATRLFFSGYLSSNTDKRITNIEWIITKTNCLIFWMSVDVGHVTVGYSYILFDNKTSTVMYNQHILSVLVKVITATVFFSIYIYFIKLVHSLWHIYFSKLANTRWINIFLYTIILKRKIIMYMSVTHQLKHEVCLVTWFLKEQSGY